MLLISEHLPSDTHPCSVLPAHMEALTQYVIAREAELIPAFAGTIMTILNVMIDVSSLDLQLFRVFVANGWCTRKQVSCAVE